MRLRYVWIAPEHTYNPIRVALWLARLGHYHGAAEVDTGPCPCGCGALDAELVYPGEEADIPDPRQTHATTEWAQ